MLKELCYVPTAYIMFWWYYAAFHFTITLISRAVDKHGFLATTLYAAIFLAVVVPPISRDIRRKKLQ